MGGLRNAHNDEMSTTQFINMVLSYVIEKKLDNQLEGFYLGMEEKIRTFDVELKPDYIIWRKQQNHNVPLLVIEVKRPNQSE